MRASGVRLYKPSQRRRSDVKYGLFKAAFPTQSKEKTISFNALSNPADPKGIIMLEAEDAAAAAKLAASLLKTLGVDTHSLLGDPDTVMADFPDYFVCQIRTKIADMYDTSSLAFRIHEFVPVPKI